MNSNAEDGVTMCQCGRSFVQPGALRKHQHSCGKTKKWLARALSKAKEVWLARKRRRVGVQDSDGRAAESQDGSATSVAVGCHRVEEAAVGVPRTAQVCCWPA